MEKISKEELMKKLNLTEEEMEKVTGGAVQRICFVNCVKEGGDLAECSRRCDSKTEAI